VKEVVVGAPLGGALKVPSLMYGDLTSESDTARSTPYMSPSTVPSYPLVGIISVLLLLLLFILRRKVH